MEKYFLINETTGFSVSIYKKDYTGASTEIFGKVSFDKGSVKDILEPIRGTVLSLQLQADSNLTFDEFSEADEKTYTVAVTKDGQTFFQGFLKPDGITQSFVQDFWIVNLDFVDGLGVLKDLAFVNSAGNNFVGKMSMFEIIQACLARTGLLMSINSSVKLKYLGYTGTNILESSYLNADRFFKIDAQASQGGTTTTCEEVLNSLLNIISACITQQDGQWWVYRPNDFEGNVDFLSHSTYRIFTKNLSITVGSQIDNFYPHHCNGNQQIETKGAVSAYRINYKYGFADSILLNPKFIHNSILIFDNWTVNPTYSSFLLLVPFELTKLTLTPDNTISPAKLVLTSDVFSVDLNSQLTISIDITSNGPSTFPFYVKLGIYYLLANGQWTTTQTLFLLNIFSDEINIVKNYTIEADLTPIDGNGKIEIFIPKTHPTNPDRATISEIQSFKITPKNVSGKIGEFHTITRNISPSSITKENQEVYNGDGTSSFVGSIYKSDKETLTTKWTRNDLIEEKPILQISGEDDMRIAQKPQKVFSGDFYGYVPYLSIVSINNLAGKFMFIEYSYDTDTNITRGKLKQFYTNEVGFLVHTFSYDYGNTVKPSIK